MEKYKITAFGWLFLILLLYLISKNTTGYKIIYNSLLIILVYLLITSYKDYSKFIFKEGGESTKGD